MYEVYCGLIQYLVEILKRIEEVTDELPKLADSTSGKRAALKVKLYDLCAEKDEIIKYRGKLTGRIDETADILHITRAPKSS